MKFPNLLRGMFRIARRFPGVFSFTVASPTNEVLKSTTKELRVSDVVDFVLFFAVDCYWIRGWWCQAVYIVPFIRAEAIHMEDVVDFEGWCYDSGSDFSDRLLTGYDYGTPKVSSYISHGQSSQSAE